MMECGHSVSVCLIVYNLKVLHCFPQGSQGENGLPGPAGDRGEKVRLLRAY